MSLHDNVDVAEQTDEQLMKSEEALGDLITSSLPESIRSRFSLYTEVLRELTLREGQ